MGKLEFLDTLKRAMSGLAPELQAKTLGFYEQRFVDGVSEGRTEEEIAASFDDPRKIAMTLRANTHMQAFQAKKNPGSLLRMLVAGIGLLIFNLFMVAPAMVYAALLATLYAAGLGFYLGGTVITASALSGANEIKLDGPFSHIFIEDNDYGTRDGQQTKVNISEDGIRVYSEAVAKDENRSSTEVTVGVPAKRKAAALAEAQAASTEAAAAAAEAAAEARQAALEAGDTVRESALAAGDAVRESADIAAEAAREAALAAGGSVREADRAASQAAREAARELRNAARESAQAARQAARESARAARETAREARDLARASARAASMAENDEENGQGRSVRVIKRAESVASQGIVVQTDSDENSRATQTAMGLAMVLGGIILLLLALVITRYTFIGIKRYIDMNLSLLKGN